MGRARAFALALAAAAGAAASAAAAPPASAQGLSQGLWSTPALLAACAGAAQPARIVFPSNSPTHRTGTGILAWANGRGCPGGEGTRVSAIAPSDIPVAATRAAAGLATGALLALRSFAVSGAPFGRVVIAGASTHGTGDSLLEGSAGGALGSPGVSAGASDALPPVLTNAYLSDVALAAPAQSHGGLRVRVQRWYSRSAWGPWRTADPAGAVSSPTIAFDYRSDVLTVWQQSGVLYARDLPASGPASALQALARTTTSVHVAALRSDDNRAIVAWSEQRGDTVSVYLDQSAVGVRFGAPELLERFSAPSGLSAPTASPTLVRLSSESVMLAWAGVGSGRWVVRVAPVDQHGLLTVGTLAAPSGDALLAGLAAGPENGALAVWTEPQPSAEGGPDLDEQAIAAARGTDTYPGVASFGPRELIAPPGPNTQPTVALDPSSGRALAVWRQRGSGLQYAIRSAPR